MIKQEIIATKRDDAVSQSVCTQSDSDDLKQELVSRIGSHKFEMWFGQTAKLSANEKTMVVTSSNQFVADWIESHFLSDLQATARKVLGQNATVEQKVNSVVFSSDSELADTKHNIKIRRCLIIGRYIEHRLQKKGGNLYLWKYAIQ